jgi:DAHL domain
VLRASHGLLLNYDPLVATVTKLREIAEELRDVGAASGASGPLMDSIAAELDEQEALVEGFKSAHALLQNSLTHFAHLSPALCSAVVRGKSRWPPGLRCCRGREALVR